MSSTQVKPRLSAPVTLLARKGDEESAPSPKQQKNEQLDENKHDDLRERHLAEKETRTRTAKTSSSERPPVVASRSLSSASSVSEAASVLSSSGESSMAATEATSRASEDGDDDDEKSSGHTAVGREKKSVGDSALAARACSDVAGRSDSTRDTTGTPTSPGSEESPSSTPRYFSQLPVASQSPAHRQTRVKPTRRSSLATVPSALGRIPDIEGTRPRRSAGGELSSPIARPLSTSPRQGLSRSYTTSAVSSMGAAIHLAGASTSPPPQFPSTSSVAPPVQNSASVTFAPAPTRVRAYSTSASGLTSPTSPAIESMTAINMDATTISPSSSASRSASPPTAPLASHQALVNATTSPPPSGTAWNTSPAGREVATVAPTDFSRSGSPPFAVQNNSSAANRRHSVDPYSPRNTSGSTSHNGMDNQFPAAGHRRHHQSISIPTSTSEYSSLGDQQHQTHQAHHRLQLNSRYRKSSLGSQALLSPTAVDKMASPPSSSLSSALNGSTSRSQPWDRNYSAGDSNNGPQLSPTRSRNDQYMSGSPRYSSRASHDAQRSNQLEAKIVLLGRQGVGKTSLVHRYITGKFSSSLPMTIGASFLVKKLDFEGGIKVRLQIWDTAGQERFRSMAPMYYRGAHAAILVYDITNDDSLADIEVWLDELRQNMSSDLIVHIVGNKADLAHTSRKITLEDAQKKIADWIARPASGVDASTLTVPQARRSTSGGHSTTSRSADEGSPSTARQGMVGLGSFNLSRSGSRQKASEELEPALPAFKDWGLEEVSAKEDDGIDMLFATIAGKLVERKNQIEQERVLRTKDSIMITDEMKGRTDDPTRVWGCC